MLVWAEESTSMLHKGNHRCVQWSKHEHFYHLLTSSAPRPFAVALDMKHPARYTETLSDKVIKTKMNTIPHNKEDKNMFYSEARLTVSLDFKLG